MNRSKWEIPSLFEIKQKANICRNRERWENKGWGAQRDERREVKASGSNTGFGKRGWWSETHGVGIQG